MHFFVCGFLYANYSMSTQNFQLPNEDWRDPQEGGADLNPIEEEAARYKNEDRRAKAELDLINRQQEGNEVY